MLIKKQRNSERVSWRREGAGSIHPPDPVSKCNFCGTAAHQFKGNEGRKFQIATERPGSCNNRVIIVIIRTRRRKIIIKKLQKKSG
jgi:hypothetical protein